MTRLLLAGATGLVGNLVLQQALTHARVSSVVALTRRPIVPHTKLTNVVIDFADMPEQASWWSVDGVISAMGTTRAAKHTRAAYRTVDVEYPLAVARLARAAGATRAALVSSVGANPRSVFTYTRNKGELELKVEELGFESLTIVRPSVIDGNRSHPRWDERLSNTLFSLLAPVLPSRLRVSPATAIAASLLNGVLEARKGVQTIHTA